jgi:hypothetical protein
MPGPTALATLVSRLLKDITAQAVDDPKHMTTPRGLLRLIQGTPQEGSTTYTRQQLEGALDGV